MECEICSEEVLFQKILNCGQTIKHCYCEKCLKRLAKENEIGTYTVICPKCREITSLMDGKVEKLPTVYHTKLSCEECSENNAVSKMWWCEMCIVLSCRTCAMLHHRNHSCSLFNSTMVDECSNYLHSALKEQQIEIKRIEDECKSIKMEKLNAVGVDLKNFEEISKSAQLFAQNRQLKDDENATGSTPSKENTERKMKFFCKIMNSIYNDQQLMCAEKVNTLISWKKARDTTQKISKEILPTFNNLPTSSSHCNLMPTLVLTNVVQLSEKYLSFSDFTVIPESGFGFVNSNGIYLFSITNGLLIASKSWSNLNAQIDSIKSRIVYNKEHKCIVINCECNNKEFGIILRVPDLKQLCKFPLPQQNASHPRQQTLIGCTEYGNVVVANANFSSHPIYFYCLEYKNGCYGILNNSFFAKSQIARNLNPFTNLFTGFQREAGQTIMYILSHSVLYKFETISLNNIDADGEVTLKQSLLSGFPVFWNYKLYIFDKISWSLTCIYPNSDVRKSVFNIDKCGNCCTSINT